MKTLRTMTRSPFQHERKRLAWLGLTLALTACASRDEVSLPTASVQRGDFERAVYAEGNLRAVRATIVAVPPGTDGPMRIAWLAADGSPVRAGEVVARFDPSEFEKNLEDSETDLATARAKRSKAEAEGGAALSNLELDAEVARRQLEAADRYGKRDEQLFSRHEIIESELDRDLAQARVAKAAKARGERRALGSSEIELLAIDERKAAIQIARSRAGLAAIEVRAPHDGLLSLVRDFRGELPKVGDTVWGSQALAEIPDLSAMEAEVFVLEADAVGLAPGKPAEVTIESRPDTQYPSRLARLDSIAKPRLRGSPVQYFAATLSLSETPPEVRKPGTRVKARIVVERRPKSLLVPRQALFEHEGKTVVYRRDSSGRFAAVAVQTGPQGPGIATVTAGLAAGDVVALVDPARPNRPAAASSGASAEGGSVGAPRGRRGGGGPIVIRRVR